MLPEDMDCDEPFNEFDLQDMLIEHLELFTDDGDLDPGGYRVDEIQRLDERAAGFTVEMHGSKFKVIIERI